MIFILVLGHFPFIDARKYDREYKLLREQKYDLYWKRVGAKNKSDDFKDLMQKMFNYDPK